MMIEVNHLSPTTQTSHLMSTTYIRTSIVRRLAKANGKRVSKAFLYAVDAYIERKIIAACNEHNGGRKTLTADIAAYCITGIRKK